MTQDQNRLLTHMKKLISEGKRRFATRRDCDYLSDLLEIGISEEESWKIILSLNANSYHYDPKPRYLTDGDALIFKRQVDGVLVYIKLKIENSNIGEETVCLSFHVDR